MDDRLQQVQFAAKRLRDLKTEYAQAVVDFKRDIANARETLDLSVVLATEDKSGSWDEIAAAAGYTSKHIVRDAKRRMMKRNEAEVR